MGESIDKSTFEQILEMDDDDDRDFSKGIVYGFFDQAESTFDKMGKALCVLSPSSLLFPNPLIVSRDEKKLQELSSLGHFLKGSSATLGLSKVKEACEKIQHYGAGKDETGTVAEPDQSASLKNIEATLKEAKEDYSEVETFLRRFYGESS